MADESLSLCSEVCTRRADPGRARESVHQACTAAGKVRGHHQSSSSSGVEGVSRAHRGSENAAKTWACRGGSAYDQRGLRFGSGLRLGSENPVS